jgi:hypothetical protein
MMRHNWSLDIDDIQRNGGIRFKPRRLFSRSASRVTRFSVVRSLDGRELMLRAGGANRSGSVDAVG